MLKYVHKTLNRFSLFKQSVFQKKSKKTYIASPSHPNNPVTIGIPRMFYYYIYPCLWETFFKELGMRTVVSGQTTAKLVEIGSRISETEHCLPNKIFDAHLSELVGTVDFIFIPRLLSTIKDHLSCPKFGPLPDAAKVDISRNTEVLTIDIDENKLSLAKSLLLLGEKLNVQKKIVQSAIATALKAMADEHARHNMKQKKKPRFLLLGHPYTIHDHFISGPIINKLKSMNIDIEIVSHGEKDVSQSYIMWCTANRIYQKLTTLSKQDYEGIIQITVFNCGCDSMMVDTYREIIKEKKIPYLYLMVDEHSAQSGIDTRIEAFIDSLRWRE